VFRLIAAAGKAVSDKAACGGLFGNGSGRFHLQPGLGQSRQ
jgi:hypothetical protein